MECKEARELLPAHADRELGLGEAMEIDRHMQDCPGCRGEFARQQALRETVKKHATYFNAPAHLEARILAALPKAPPVTRVKWAWRWNWLNAGAALASVFALVWSIGLYLAVPSADDLLADEVVSNHVRSLMVDHIADVASSDQHTVKPWFNGKLDFSPTVNDFSAQGFPLVGGRLDYFDRRPVAALVYRHRQHLINVYVWRSNGKREAGVQTLSRHGYNLAHWVNSRGMVHWVISDLDPRELMTLVPMLCNADGVPATG